jgi:uncharacterized ParB-like nuclease family protein
MNDPHLEKFNELLYFNFATCHSYQATSDSSRSKKKFVLMNEIIWIIKINGLHAVLLKWFSNTSSLYD